MSYFNGSVYIAKKNLKTNREQRACQFAWKDGTKKAIVRGLNMKTEQNEVKVADPVTLLFSLYRLSLSELCVLKIKISVTKQFKNFLLPKNNLMVSANAVMAI